MIPVLTLSPCVGFWIRTSVSGGDLDRCSRAVGLSLHGLSPFFVHVMPPVVSIVVLPGHSDYIRMSVCPTRVKKSL